VGSAGSLLDNRIYSEKMKGMTKERWSVRNSLIDSSDVSDHPSTPIQAFVDSLNKEKPMPLTDFETAYESHRVVFAADLSAKEKRR
jgi:predicted dehydrogenase